MISIRPCGEIIREISDSRDAPIDGNIMNTHDQVALRNLFIKGYLPDVCMNCSYLMCNEFDWSWADVDEYYDYFRIK